MRLITIIGLMFSVPSIIIGIGFTSTLLFGTGSILLILSLIKAYEELQGD